MPDKGIIKLHGREYKTVALRVAEFRALHPISEGWRVVTHPHAIGDEAVIFRASIMCPEGREVAVGWAEERRESRGVNSTSALENCETSAIGRALAAAGFGGSEYASADELTRALRQQAEPLQVAQNSKPMQSQADEARRANHHETWEQPHIGWFMARLAELGISYEDVANYCQPQWGRPSEWPIDKRRGLVDSLARGEHKDIPRAKRKRRK